MFPTEPMPTALLLAVFGGLLALSAILSRTLGRIGVPVVLLFLVIGMLAGSEGIGGIYFDDYQLTFRIGTVALAFILFDGGLNTPMSALKGNVVTAGVLATVGVLVTAALVAVVGRWIGFSWPEAFLLGAVVSSTDAAAVFSVLRGSGLHLKKRVGATLELESGLNDPMAVILTVTLTQSLIQPGSFGVGLVGLVIWQLVAGVALGVGIGLGGRMLLRRWQPFAGGLFPVLTLSIACLAFAIPTLLQGSGFLAVYVAGVVLGNGPLPYKAGLLRVHDFIAWFFQVVMFVTLGLLVFPSNLPGIAWVGLAVAAFLALIARPVAVVLCLLPLRFLVRFSARELFYMSWVGLRGAVPIILATFPVLAGVPSGGRIFDIVFFVVVVSALAQGGTTGWLTRKLGLVAKAPPPAPALLEITSTKLLEGEMMSFYIEPTSAVSGASMAEVPFPEGAAAMLVIRGNTLLAPRGHTRLQAGDHVYVFCRPEDRAFMRLLFGHEENE